MRASQEAQIGQAGNTAVNNPSERFVQPMGRVNAHARGLRPIPLTLAEGTKNERLILAGGGS